MVNTSHPGASGLRLVRDNRYLLATDGVEQRGLSNIWSTDEGHESAAHVVRVVTNIAFVFMSIKFAGEHLIDFPTSYAPATL